MKLLTKRDCIRTVAERWQGQYPVDKHLNDAADRTSAQIHEELIALNPETATAEDVALIIGNYSWTDITCDECGEQVDGVMIVGAGPSLSSFDSVALCRSCIERALGCFSSAREG